MLLKSCTRSTLVLMFALLSPVSLRAQDVKTDHVARWERQARNVMITRDGFRTPALLSDGTPLQTRDPSRGKLYRTGRLSGAPR